MVASRNQFHGIAREFGTLPNGSMAPYFGGNELRQNISEYELFGRKNTNLGSMGALGAGPMDFAMLLAMGSVYVGLDFPGARTTSRTIKRFVKKPIPVIQTGLLFAGTAAILLRQFRVI